MKKGNEAIEGYKYTKGTVLAVFPFRISLNKIY